MKAKRKGTVATQRLRKAECEHCGYIVYTSRKWLRQGPPICPCGAGAMRCPRPEDQELYEPS